MTALASVTIGLSGDPAAPVPAAGSLGVNLSGLELDANPGGVAGVNYAVPTAAELAYYHAQGLDLIRLPFSWAALQPTLGGPLDPTYLGQIVGVVNAAAALGMKVILNAHDAGGYGYGANSHNLGDGTLTDADFANLWQQVSATFAGNPGLGGYDLLNEPHDIPDGRVWPAAAQAAINAIRTEDTATPIYVEGDNYSSAGTWTASNVPALAQLKDPANNLIFSAHLYLDTDNTGTQTDWAQQAAAGETTAIGADRLANFMGWLQANGLRGDIGEIGVPNTDPAWLTGLDTTLAAAQADGLQVTAWAGGPWWGNDPFSLDPDANGTPTPQVAVLDKYTGALASVTMPLLTGTADPGAAVTLSENGAVLGTATANAAGTWSDLLGGLAQGEHTVVATEPGGANVGAVSFLLDAAPATTTSDAGAAIVSGSHAQYVLADSDGTPMLEDEVAGRDGTQLLPDAATVQFSDGMGVLDPTGSDGEVARLYQAAFDRSSDLGGLQYWAGQLDSGTLGLADVAGSFIGSAEFQGRYGALDDADYVSQLYGNVLGRAGDAGGIGYWTGQLANGASRAQVLVGFSDSPENEANTAADIGDANRGEAYRLYQAAFDRTPDEAGLDYWTGSLAAGATPLAVAAGFTGSAEFAATYTGADAAGIVTQLYGNVLHRAPDAAGAQYWVSQLEGGASEASVLLGFSDSAENRVATAAATHDGWVFLPGG